jgi:putative salt-induced outer membrane protein YdiY
VSVQTAGFNTRTIAEAAITTKISGSMQMKVGVKATHNTKTEREKLDTETSVTLVVII